MLFCMDDRLVCVPDSHPFRITSTKCRINTVISPDDGHIVAGNMYLLTPWSRVILEKVTGSAASQEIPRIFGTRRFLTVPTSARHLSLS